MCKSCINNKLFKRFVSVFLTITLLSHSIFITSAYGEGWLLELGTDDGDSAQAEEKLKTQYFKLLVLEAEGIWANAAEITMYTRGSDGLLTPSAGIEVLDASSEESVAEKSKGGTKESAFDGNVNTFWHTKWANGEAFPPHWLSWKMQSDAEVFVLQYMPRSDSISHGNIKQYKLYLSQDAIFEADEVVSKGAMPGSKGYIEIDTR